jgi:hypothetical protein
VPVINVPVINPAKSTGRTHVTRHPTRVTPNAGQRLAGP